MYTYDFPTEGNFDLFPATSASFAEVLTFSPDDFYQLPGLLPTRK